MDGSGVKSATRRKMWNDFKPVEKKQPKNQLIPESWIVAHW